jgi:hypothetical protein
VKTVTLEQIMSAGFAPARERVALSGVVVYPWVFREEEPPQVEGPVICPWCSFSWSARRPETFSGLACPRCMGLTGVTFADLEQRCREYVEMGLADEADPYRFEWTVEQGRRSGDLSLELLPEADTLGLKESESCPVMELRTVEELDAALSPYPRHKEEKE